MRIVQGGVTHIHPESPAILTKKHLKRLVDEEPEKVMFYDTGVGSGIAHYRGSVAQLPDHTRLIVVGPNPYRDRSWFAEVFWKNGKLKVT